jgi:predicted transcriptional regulator
VIKNIRRILWSIILIIGVALTILIGWIAFSDPFFSTIFIQRISYSAFAFLLVFIIISSIGLLNSTITRENILNNYTRAKIFTLIKTNPGIHFSEIIRNLNLSKGQTSWHLTYLERFDLIKRVKNGQYLTFFPNIGFYYEEEEESMMQTALSKSKTRNLIFETIIDRPAITQVELKKIAQISQSTLAYHLIILEQLNLIYIKKKGRKRYYFPYDEFALNLDEKNHKQILK